MNYLLNQTIRMFHFDSSHFLVSKAAQQCWDELVVTSEDNSPRIDDFFNNEIIECKKVDHPELFPRYIGARKIAEHSCIWERKGKYYFKFNDLFHCEHIVPVNQIVDKLMELPSLSEASVLEIINKIYICKILKEEDRRIPKKSNRGDDLDYLRIINTIYKEVGIEVL